MKKYYLLVLIVCILSPWFWIIIEKNLLTGFICLPLSVLIFDSLFQKEISYIKKIIILVSFFSLSVYLLIVSFDGGIFKKTDIEFAQIVKRQDYYSVEFGKTYRNRFGVYYTNNFRPFVYKYVSNIANVLDLETYFASSNDKMRFSIVFLPLMIVGFYLSLKKINKWMVGIIVFTLILSGFINVRTDIGPIIFYPLICSYISLGIVKLLKI